LRSKADMLSPKIDGAWLDAATQRLNANSMIKPLVTFAQ
jgi:hypothetical protein